MHKPLKPAFAPEPRPDRQATFELRFSQAQSGRRALMAFAHPMRTSRMFGRLHSEIENTHKKCEALVSNTGAGMTIVDTTETFLISNSALERIFGVETLAGRNLLDFVRDPAQLEILRQQTESRIEGHSSNYELEITRESDGSRRTVQIIADPQRDESGWVIASVGVIVDVTEQKAKDRALQLATFSLEQTPMPFFRIGDDGRIEYANAAASELLCHPKAELEGLHIVDVDPTYTKPKLQELWAALEEKGHICFETLIKTKDGSLVPIEVNISSMQSEGKHLKFAFFRDISERKKRESELATQRAQMAEMTKFESMASVAAGLGHEVNNALQPLSLSLDLIGMLIDEAIPALQQLRNTQFSTLGFAVLKALSNIKNRVDAMYANIQVAASITQGVASFARRDRSLRVFSLEESVRSAVAISKGQWKPIAQDQRKNITVSIEKSPDCFVFGNSGQLTGIIINLINNAVAEMKPGDGKIVISWSQATNQESEDIVVLSVSNNGPQIKPEIAQQLLRGPVTSTHSGEGMGLAIARSTIERFGGSISFDSGESLTTFQIILRAGQGEQGHVHNGKLSKAQLSRKILVVDDEPYIRDALTEFLDAMGHEFQTFSDPLAAIEEFRKGDYEIVVTDQSMPKMNGVDLAAEIRKIRPQTTLILMTGHANITLGRGELGLFHELLIKPFDGAAFNEAIESAVAKRDRIAFGPKS